MQEFAQLLGRHHDLVRAAAPEDGDRLDTAGAQGVERMGDDIRPGKLAFGLGQDPCDVERDIPHANHDRMLAR